MHQQQSHADWLEVAEAFIVVGISWTLEITPLKHQHCTNRSVQRRDP